MSARKAEQLELIRIAKSLFAAALLLPMVTADSAPGQILNNSGQIPFEQSFFAFEVESPLESMKNVPIWDELEQMLDNPYAIMLDPNTAPNAQGFSSYVATIQRRRSFLPFGCSYDPTTGLTPCNDALLPRHTVHPLNYNHMTGEEMRVLNPHFEGAEHQVPDLLLRCSNPLAASIPACAGIVNVTTITGEIVTTGPFSTERGVWTYKTVTVSAGDERVEEGETAADFNSPFEADVETCIVSTELITFSNETSPPVEGVTICGGDPGEPGFEGFGVLLADNAGQYSVPAVPGSTRESHIGVGGSSLALYDPERGYISARNQTTGLPSVAGTGVLRKPSIRVPEAGGTPANPNYTINTDPDDVSPSNENDYYRGVTRAQKQTARRAAEALGKALFWDMQVGSDTVQSCGTCHFSAGVDDRTKNQLNPNHLGNDFDLEVFANRTAPPLNPQDNNQDVVASDFPFHKLNDISVSGECAAHGDGIVDNNCGNVVRHSNDVMSSMGVRFRQFVDIPPIGTGANQSFGPADASGVRTLLPDVGNAVPDPIALFQGKRRVEPRNTPTMFAAALNFDNFWDGRARHDFNGGSVFGPTDPQSHVFVCSSPNGAETQCTGGPSNFVATRQIIRFASVASLATGPALSDFEMSFAGRNWAKLGKKLLQGTMVNDRLVGNVTPLANQLVSTADSAMGLYSNQGGSACAGLPAADRSPGTPAVGKPGLCISYPGLIRRAFYPHLWVASNRHLNGCYTDGAAFHSAEQCAAGSVAIPVLGTVAGNPAVVDSAVDPFDNYVLSIAPGAANATNRNQFTQMEANFSLFFGLSVHAWVTMLMPDHTPFDQFMDANPDSFQTFGEANEPGIGLDFLNCTGPNGTGGVQPCFTEVGNFKRDPGVVAMVGVSPTSTGTPQPAGGSRVAGSVDPLLGLDMFLGSNLSLKNPNFRSFRCGECHAAGTFTDHTVEISHQASFGDFVQEFITGMPGFESFPEPLGRSRVITGFALEGELQENAQDGIERNIANFCTVLPCSQPEATVANGFPQAQALFDNGVYNIGVTPIANDISRGGTDAFGWPLSLSILALKNLGGVAYSPGGENPANGFADPPAPGIPLLTFDPEAGPGCAGQNADYLASHVECNTGGLFEPSAQDQQINPGFAEEPANPLLPAYLARWASNIPVGDETNQDEVFFGLNTLMREPMLEGFNDLLGPFNPAATVGENFNSSNQRQMATWPVVNKVNRMGSFKAPPLRNVELTGPYFHNGGTLTLRQQVDFYMRGGNFVKTNSAHRDFLIMNLNLEDEALGDGVDIITGLPIVFTEAEKEERRVALVDFLLELTDQRVRFAQAPFDHPEVFVPLDGTAPDNGSLAGAVTAGRPGFLNNLANGMFRHIKAVGAGGRPGAVPGDPNTGPVPNFLGISSGPRLVGAAANCGPAANNHYCH